MASGVPVNVMVEEEPSHTFVLPLIAAVGKAFTTITALPEISPPVALQFASFSVAIVYVVFEPGVTVGKIVGADPEKGIEPGFNVPLIVPVPVTLINNGAESPIQIDCEPPIAPVGRGFTVTTALPLKSPPFAEQLASLNVEIVNVVFDVGLTDTEIGLDEPLNEAPLERVPFHGPVPVTTIERDGESPLQIVVVPLIVPVGREFTVITALPVRSPPTATQFASFNVAIV